VDTFITHSYHQEHLPQQQQLLVTTCWLLAAARAVRELQELAGVVVVEQAVFNLEVLA
jgi:hypothetical protein